MNKVKSIKIFTIFSIILLLFVVYQPLLCADNEKEIELSNTSVEEKCWWSTDNLNINPTLISPVFNITGWDRGWINLLKSHKMTEGDICNISAEYSVDGKKWIGPIPVYSQKGPSIQDWFIDWITIKHPVSMKNVKDANYIKIYISYFSDHEVIVCGGWRIDHFSLIDENDIAHYYHNFPEDADPDTTEWKNEAHIWSPEDKWQEDSYQKPRFSEIWVDDNYNNQTALWNIRCFNNINTGLECLSDKGILNVLVGDYKEKIFIDRELNIVGEKENSVRISGTDNSENIITIKPHTDHVNISNINFENGNIGINIGDECDDIEINKCYFIKNNCGLYLEGASNIFVKDCQFKSNTNSIKITLYSTDNEFWRNKIHGELSSYPEEATKVGIEISGFSDNNKFYRNEIFNHNEAIIIKNSDNTIFHGNNIQGNNFHLRAEGSTGTDANYNYWGNVIVGPVLYLEIMWEPFLPAWSVKYEKIWKSPIDPLGSKIKNNDLINSYGRTIEKNLKIIFNFIEKIFMNLPFFDYEVFKGKIYKIFNDFSQLEVE